MLGSSRTKLCIVLIFPMPNSVLIHPDQVIFYELFPCFCQSNGKIKFGVSIVKFPVNKCERHLRKSYEYFLLRGFRYVAKCWVVRGKIITPTKFVKTRKIGVLHLLKKKSVIIFWCVLLLIWKVLSKTHEKHFYAIASFIHK